MAGLSSRFTRAGYTQPKYMLPLAGRPMLDWSILSFSADLAIEPVLFVYRDVAGTADFVRERAAACGITHPLFVQLEAPTAGQAETVARGLEVAGVTDAEPLTIFNIDTLRPGLRAVHLQREAGLLEVVEAEGDHWSFVLPQPGRPGRAARVTEKERVSDLCCTGLYAFRTAGEFRRVQAGAELIRGELFIAPLYNQLIVEGLDVGYVQTAPELVFLAGTPEEYTAALTHEADIIRAYAAAAQEAQA
jgi:dTDP-glucose pyrophosphorylase